MNTTKKVSEIVLGDVSVNEDELNLSGAKIRITMIVDLETVQAFKALAQKNGSKYQTLMNKKLKESLLSEEETSSLEKRVTRLEKLVLSRRKVS